MTRISSPGAVIGSFIVSDWLFLSFTTNRQHTELFQMKKLISAVAIIFGCAWVGWAADAPNVLTSVEAISALSNAQASQALPVAFEATVTYNPGYSDLLFVQEGKQAVFVLDKSSVKLLPGDGLWSGERRKAASVLLWSAKTLPFSTTALRFSPCQPPSMN